MKAQIENSNLRDQIYEIIHDMILAREILPGEKILEEDLAIKFGVSRTPIRECLFRLEHEGIVEFIPRRGAFLRKYSEKKIAEIFDMREVLEGLVARLVAATNDNADLNSVIRLVLDRVYMLTDQGENLTNFTRADIEFHQLLLNACDNEMLQNAMAVINTHLRLIRVRTVVIPGRARRTVEEHYKVLDAIEKHDPEDAEKQMRRHIVSVRNHALHSLNFNE
ncbi:MAG: GntR family transcriptional regulator [Desulfatiglandaceae bacterium]